MPMIALMVVKTSFLQQLNLTLLYLIVINAFDNVHFCLYCASKHISLSVNNVQ